MLVIATNSSCQKFADNHCDSDSTHSVMVGSSLPILPKLAAKLGTTFKSITVLTISEVSAMAAG